MPLRTNTNTLLTACAIALALCSTLAAAAQDTHFAHLAAVPTQVNPAYTGLTEAKARVGVDYRSQWNNFTNGFRTASLSADMKAYESRSGVAGVGLFVNSDKAGDLDFSTQQIGLSGSYLKVLDRGRTFVSFGMQVISNHRRIDWSKAEAFDYEPLAGASENGASSFYSVGTGAAFFQKPNRNLSWFVGVAGAHLNRPDVSMLDDDSNEGDFLYRKFTYHAGAEIKFGRFNSIRPSIIYLRQGPNRQIKVGSFYRFKADRGISTDGAVAAHIGIFARSYVADANSGFDALIIAARFDYQNTVITASFDTNVSSLTKASNGVGGPEFSVVQTFDWGSPRKRRHKVECPTFQY